MKKIRVMLAACVVAATSLLFAAPTAHAWTCEDDLDDACRVAATVICKVVVKGQPCIY